MNALNFINFVFRSLLRKCIRNNVLAPTLDQRVSYKNWLHVYGKKKIEVTPRLCNLIKSFEVAIQVVSFKTTYLTLEQESIEILSHSSDISFRDSTVLLFDPFEPNYLRPSLEATGRESLDYNLELDLSKTTKYLRGKEQPRRPNLGHLVFGDEAWTTLGISSIPHDDPLTQYFQENGTVFIFSYDQSLIFLF